MWRVLSEQLNLSTFAIISLFVCSLVSTACECQDYVTKTYAILASICIYFLLATLANSAFVFIDF